MDKHELKKKIIAKLNKCDSIMAYNPRDSKAFENAEKISDNLIFNKHSPKSYLRVAKAKGHPLNNSELANILINGADYIG